MEIITILLLLVMQATTQDILVDNTSSGDGEELFPIPTTPEASLIDDNGDILDISTEDSLVSTFLTTLDNEAISESLSSSSTAFPETTEDTTSPVSFIETTMAVTEKNVSDIYFSTTDASTTLPIVETSTVTDVPTTTVTVKESTTTTIKETTKTTVESTTEKPLTTSVPVVKSSTSTTDLPSTVTATTEFKQTTSKVLTVPTMEMPYIPSNEDEPCSFMDDNLKCVQDIICYGNGEIDCRDEIEANPAGTTFTDKFSSVPEDYSDYDEDEDGIATFPPNLVGVKSDKKPLFSKKGSLDSDDSQTMHEDHIDKLTTETPMENTLTEYVPIENKPIEYAPTGNSRLLRFRAMLRKNPGQLIQMPYPNIETQNFPNKIYNADSNAQETSEKNRPTTAVPITVMTHIQDALTTRQTVTSRIMTPLSTETFSSSVTEDSHVIPVYARSKREENPSLKSDSPSIPLSFQKALENSKKIRMRSCRLIGNLSCTPPPSIVMCIGRTVCQAVHGTAETSEKSMSTRGMENWAIIVICICAIASTLTVSLLIYLVFTSWKKLKVRPQNGVTTLTYVNSSAP